MIQSSHSAVAMWIILASLYFVSCNESLPVYIPPSDIFGASVRPLNALTDTVRYSMRDDNNPNLVRVTLITPFNGYEIAIVNRYEETIQDKMEIEGTVDLLWAEKPDLNAVLTLSNTSIYDGDLDPVTGLLTVNPGDTIRLRVFWNFRLTTNDWAFTQVRYTDGPAYSIGPMQVVSDRFHQTMLLNAVVKVKIFRSLSFIEAHTKESIPVLFKGRITYPP